MIQYYSPFWLGKTLRFKTGYVIFSYLGTESGQWIANMSSMQLVDDVCSHETDGGSEQCWY